MSASNQRGSAHKAGITGVTEPLTQDRTHVSTRGHADLPPYSAAQAMADATERANRAREAEALWVEVRKRAYAARQAALWCPRRLEIDP